MVPEGWELVTLGELIEDGFQNGLYKPSSAYGEGTSIIRINDFDNEGNFTTSKYQRLAISDAELERFGVQENDILINRVNSLSHIGKSAIVREVSEPMVYESNMMRLRLEDYRLHPDFLSRLLLSSPTRNYFVKVAKKAVAQASINQDDVKSLEFLLPPLEQQRKIADILSTWDEAIKTLEKLINAKEKRKRALMQGLLTGKKRFKEFAGLEWQETVFDDVFDIEIGGTPARKNLDYWDTKGKTQNYWVAISDLQNKHIAETKERITDLGAKKSNTKLFPTGTVIMSFKLTIGRAAILTRPMYTNEAICALLPKYPNLIDTEFLYQSLAAVNFEKEIDQAVKGKTLNKDKLKRLRLNLPSLQEQQKIASVLSSADAEISTLQRGLELYKRQKRGLMQELLTGKTRVKVGEGAP